MRRPLRILISAGETSGDRLGAGLAEALRRRSPDLELLGMGSDRMAAQGVRIIQDSSEVAVVGIVEVLSHLPAIRAAMSRIERALDDERPDLLIPVDFPDFNLRLAARARRRGIPVVYFVSPQVWAWRRGRVRLIRRLVRRMLVLFPFEVPFYSEAGVPVSFVGHPLAEVQEEPPSRLAICERFGLDPQRPIVALLPGSRRIEVERLLPVMLEAAALLSRTRPELQFVLPLAPGLSRETVEAMIADAEPRPQVCSDAFPTVLSACECGVVAAGTASLEVALTGLPMVVVYRMGFLSYVIGRALVRVDHVALPNLVAGRRLVPELIQGECRADRIAELLEGYLSDSGRAEILRGELLGLRERLGGAGVFERAADAVMQELSPTNV